MLIKNMFWAVLIVCFVSADAGTWILTIETDSNWMAGFAGDTTVCLTYRISNLNLNNETSTQISSKHEECKSLSKRRFIRGETYMFDLELSFDASTIEELKLFSKPISTSVCKRKTNLDSWHVKRINIQDLQTGSSFEVIKHYQIPFIIQQRCSDGHELILVDFNVTTEARPCLFDGNIYKNEEYFDNGCSARCQCLDGGISCVSMCPPSISLDCREVYVPGKCCQEYICENKQNYYPNCPTYEEGDCEMMNRTVETGEFPWTAFVKICNKKRCHFCSGAIISENYVLTSANCVKSVSNYSQDIKIILGESSVVLSEDSDVEMSVQNVSYSSKKPNQDQIALIKLNEAIVFDQTVQPATLPLNKQQCLMLTRPKCASTMTGWINVDVESQQYDLYKINVNLADHSECNSNISVPTRKRKPSPPTFSGSQTSICVDLGNDEVQMNSGCNCEALETADNSSNGCSSDKNAYLCSGELGRVLTSKMQVPTYDENLEVNYLVGVVTQSLSSSENCKKSAFKLAVNLCSDLDWIRQTIYNYYY
ncbi:hypothetical protein CHUAL_011332 [Chamberlinius hualienensis]